MLNDTDAAQIMGRTAYDADGNKLGKVGQVYLDDATGRPEFVTVNTGLFGTSESFVPVESARIDNDTLVVPYTKDQVKDAPNVDLNGGHLDESEEQRLYAHYGLSGNATTADYDTTYTEGNVAPAGHDTSGPSTDDAMTRSEEHLNVGTTQEQAGRVKLRKYVTTETETHTVPVRKERAVLETEPITDGNVGDALEGPAISEEEHEVVLHEERPVVEKVAQPVERVRVGTETVTENETVTDEVRKEHIEAEGDVDRR